MGKRYRKLRATACTGLAAEIKGLQALLAQRTVEVGALQMHNEALRVHTAAVHLLTRCLHEVKQHQAASCSIMEEDTVRQLECMRASLAPGACSTNGCDLYSEGGLLAGLHHLAPGNSLLQLER